MNVNSFPTNSNRLCQYKYADQCPWMKKTNGRKCLFRHLPRYALNSEICKFFLTKKGCKKGATCKFKHEQPNNIRLLMKFNCNHDLLFTGYVRKYIPSDPTVLVNLILLFSPSDE
eukprot:UN07059